MSHTSPARIILPQKTSPVTLEDLEATESQAFRVLHVLSDAMHSLPDDTSEIPTYNRIETELGSERLKLDVMLNHVQEFLELSQPMISTMRCGNRFTSCCHEFPVIACMAWEEEVSRWVNRIIQDPANFEDNTHKKIFNACFNGLQHHCKFFDLDEHEVEYARLRAEIHKENIFARQKLKGMTERKAQDVERQEDTQGNGKLTKQECCERWKQISGTKAISYCRTVDNWISQDKLKADDNGLYCESEFLKLATKSKLRAKSKHKEDDFDLEKSPK